MNRVFLNVNVFSPLPVLLIVVSGRYISAATTLEMLKRTDYDDVIRK
jgi:hypothetical protein